LGLPESYQRWRSSRLGRITDALEEHLAIRRVRGWLGAPPWRLARFRTVKELRSLVEAHGLNVNRIAGAIYYPPVRLAAVLLARFDVAFARWTSVGAAFIAISGIKADRVS